MKEPESSQKTPSRTVSTVTNKIIHANHAMKTTTPAPTFYKLTAPLMEKLTERSNASGSNGMFPSSTKHNQENSITNENPNKDFRAAVDSELSRNTNRNAAITPILVSEPSYTEFKETEGQEVETDLKKGPPSNIYGSTATVGKQTAYTNAKSPRSQRSSIGTGLKKSLDKPSTHD